MWSTIIGHKRQIEQLQRMLTEGKVPHAFLFSGHHGVGKHHVATIVAAALTCPMKTACGSCVSCAKIKKRQHPDTFFVAPDGDWLKIEQIRTLTAQLQFHPLEGMAKVAIIDDADRMTESAANALLKTLEEPPPLTYFILVSSHPRLLPATIRSRCQNIAFSPLAEKEIETYLVKQAGKDHEMAGRLASLAQGSLGSALALDPEVVDATLNDFTTLFHKASSADILEIAHAWATSEDQSPVIVESLSGLYRDALLRKTCGAITTPLHPRHALPPLSVETLDKAFMALHRSWSLLTTTANKQLLFEDLLFTLLPSSSS